MDFTRGSHSAHTPKHPCGRYHCLSPHPGPFPNLSMTKAGGGQQGGLHCISVVFKGSARVTLRISAADDGQTASFAAGGSSVFRRENCKPRYSHSKEPGGASARRRRLPPPGHPGVLRLPGAQGACAPGTCRESGCCLSRCPERPAPAEKVLLFLVSPAPPQAEPGGERPACLASAIKGNTGSCCRTNCTGNSPFQEGG